MPPTLMQVLCLVLVAVPMATALAHALEMPGKLRLARDDYLTVQTIYYPGFSRAGIAEPLAIVALLVLAFTTPRGTAAFPLTLAALAAVIAMHAIYWTRTEPVNRVWLKELQLNRADSLLFRAGRKLPTEGAPENWIELRDQWEHSHLARAACSALAFLFLAIAIAL